MWLDFLNAAMVLFRGLSAIGKELKIKDFPEFLCLLLA